MRISSVRSSRRVNNRAVLRKEGGSIKGVFLRSCRGLHFYQFNNEIKGILVYINKVALMLQGFYLSKSVNRGMKDAEYSCITANSVHYRIF